MMSVIRKFMRVTCVFVFLSVLWGCSGELSAAQAAANWQPSKVVTIIVQAGAGGGSDIYARKFAEIINNKKLSPYPVVVENRPGGGGAIAYNYVGIQKKGEPHFLTTAVDTFLTTPLQGRAEVTYKDFTAIARMGIDSSNVLLVPKNSQWDTIEELIEYARANPEYVNIGCGNLGSADTVMTYLLEQNAKIKLNYVIFSGGSEVVPAALGGHVDVVWANAAEILDYVKNGDLKVLATINTERLESMPDIPTFIEKGYPNIQYPMFRGFVAPGNIPAEATAYWENTARQVYDSPEWQEGYMKKNMITPGFMGSKEFAQELADRNVFYEEILKGLGLIVSPK
jgi:putative tricarboxylic transport membrane protein